MIGRVTLLVLAFVPGAFFTARAETRFAVDPEAGNNTFSAVFDAAIGERITAVSSAVGCTLSVDEAKLQGKASCSVPLTSIRVDNDDTKSDHFRQWATNKKVDPSRCLFKLEVPGLKLDTAVEPMKPVPFETEGTFTICGRPRREDQRHDHLSPGGQLQGRPHAPHSGEDRRLQPRALPDRSEVDRRLAGTRAGARPGRGSRRYDRGEPVRDGAR
jgi:hypothetical protein